MTAEWQKAWAEADKREWGDNFTRREIATRMHIRGWNDAIQFKDAEIARLHEALREHVLSAGLSTSTTYCHVCGESWQSQDPEEHAPGCLAAPREPAP